MMITTAQKQTLAIYARYHQKNPTVGGLIRANLKQYLIFLAILIVLYVVGPSGQTGWLTQIAAGMVIGMFLRDLSRYSHLVRTWPIVRSIINWPKLEAILAAENGEDAAL